MAKTPETVIVAFVPVLHVGYLDFIKKNSGKVYLLGPSLIADFPRLERDIRALPVEKIEEALKAVEPSRSIEILNLDKISEINTSSVKIIIPDEEISHTIAEKHFPKKEIDYQSVFLRWDRRISDKEYEIDPDRKISVDETDKGFIILATDEGKKSPDWWRQIGSVLVKGGKVILSAHNKHLPSHHYLSAFGDPRSSFDAGERPDIYLSVHSEISILAQAAKAGISVKDGSLYVSTFPCPNCARAISEAGIKKVYYAKGYSLRDAEMILKASGIEIILVQ